MSKFPPQKPRIFKNIVVTPTAKSSKKQGLKLIYVTPLLSINISITLFILHWHLIYLFFRILSNPFGSLNSKTISHIMSAKIRRITDSKIASGDVSINFPPSLI